MTSLINFLGFSNVVRQGTKGVLSLRNEKHHRASTRATEKYQMLHINSHSTRFVSKAMCISEVSIRIVNLCIGNPISYDTLEEDPKSNNACLLTESLHVEETSNVPNPELHSSRRKAFVDQRVAVEGDGLHTPATCVHRVIR